MTTIGEEKLKKLLKYVQADGRICPLPIYWQTLWEMLPNRKQKASGGWIPPLPLILGAWQEPGMLKRLRLKEHIEYAAEHGVLDEVDKSLRDLSEEQWFYIK